MLNLHLDFNGKSAHVGLHGLPTARPRRKIELRLPGGAAVVTARVAKGLASGVVPSLESLRDGDPEIDLHTAGLVFEAESLTPAWYDPAEPDKPVADFRMVDVIHDASGAEKTRRPHLVRAANLDELHPVKLGKRLPLHEALSQFVIKQSLQLAHTDGLTFDFLKGIAEELSSKQEVAILGAGPKGNLPLVVRQGGAPYRALLHGEVHADGRYKLLLLLSDQELKLPELAE
jgi:hypothetical protein